ncbi:MAG: transcriptional repressor [Bacteroidales bacterium]|jgi:Fe2+ or Zn2+ uptake regulation protein|nr:transcriptional repressor [Bacteroidales bacterium]MCI2122046.1 transcriptional repressor [Bacteroidales bacterium]MCI2145343.1 transcriptional repressor [Bacteroidales bacterium]
MRDDVKDILRKHDLKATPQRIMVYGKLLELGHASADMIYTQLNKENPEMTVATTYNILESFVKAGIIKRLFSSTNKMFFDINTKPHCHIYTETGDHYTDLFDPKLTEIISDYLLSKKIRNFEIEDVSIEIVAKRKNEKNYK